MKTFRDLIRGYKNKKENRDFSEMVNDLKFHQWQIEHRSEMLELELNELIHQSQLSKLLKK